MNEENTSTKTLILSYLKEGLLKKDSAALAGIDESTFYRWISADASFASQVQASVLEYKRSLIQHINTSMQKDGRLALEILRQRWPNDGKEEIEKSEETEGEIAKSLLKLFELQNHNKDQEAIDTFSSGVTEQDLSFS